MRTELALGITGGILGLVFSLVGYFFFGIGYAIAGIYVEHRTNTEYLAGLLWSGIFGSLIGIVGSAIGVGPKPKAGGSVMLFGSVLIMLTFAGAFAHYFLNMFPFVLITVGGIMLLRHRPKPTIASSITGTTMDAHVSARLPPDLSPTEYLILRTIRHGINKPKEIADALSMDKEEVKRIIDALEYKGYINKDKKLTSKSLDILQYMVVIGIVSMLMLSNVLPMLTPVYAEEKVKYLAKEELVTAEPRWVTRTNNINETIIIWGYPFSNYGYTLIWKPFTSSDNIKDVTLSGTAEEKSDPKIPFNIFIFDEVNFELWKERRNYVAYYEAENVTSTTFTIQFKDELPDTIYLVVKSITSQAPIVQVNADWIWLEENKWFKNYADDITIVTPLFPYAMFNTPMLKVEAKEVNGKTFNFYILDSTNYSNWYSDKPYKAYYVAEKVTTADFSMQLPNESLWLYLVVENISEEADDRITVSITAMVTEAETKAETKPEPAKFRILVAGIKEDVVVDGSITTGYVKNIIIDKSSNSIIISLGNVNNDSILTITLPPEIVQKDERDEFGGATFSVFTTMNDGTYDTLHTLNFTDSKEGNNRVLTIEVPAGTEQVMIILDNVRVVPEFGASMVMITLAIAVTGILLASRRGLIQLIPARGYRLQ